MKRTLHLTAAILATSLIAVFWLSSLLVEAFGTWESVAAVKRLIVFPGLFLLVPALAATGGTGFLLGKGRAGVLVEAKRQRMPFIALNGLLVLVPCALVLHARAQAGAFDTWFHGLQALELAAGALNLFLMSLNMRDGLRLTHVRERLA